MITINERRDMRRMGYSIKVVFERPKNKVPFTKYFTTPIEADEFSRKAKENGIRMIERDELYEKTAG